MKLQIGIIALAIAWTSVVSAQQIQTSKNLIGKNQCNVLLYAWPTSTNDKPVLIADGWLELSGDGKGHWTSGVVNFQMTSGSKCQLSVVKGTYNVNGSLGSQIDWKITEGTAAECGGLVAGYASGKTSGSTTMTTDVSAYPDSRGGLNQLGFGPLGFATGKCNVHLK